MNRDLPKHAGDKVQRALDDVLQLTGDAGERLRIALFASGICIGHAAGTLHAMMLNEGHAIGEREVKVQIIELLRVLMLDGADKAWQQLGGGAGRPSK